jgi:hypothetical protein
MGNRPVDILGELKATSKASVAFVPGIQKQDQNQE